MQIPQNIQRLADYINSQPNPEQFMQTLFSFCKPCTDNLPNRHEKSEVRIG